VKGTIPKKYTFFGTEVKFPIVVRAKVRPTSTPKHTKESVVWGLTKETLQRSFHIDDTTRKPIYEKACSGKGITPKMKRNRGMGK
jgi:hypothetical protein